MSLRKIRRHRKYRRLLNKVAKQIAKSEDFKKAIHDLMIFGTSVQYIDDAFIKRLRL